jgi:hypothetical protein
MAVVNLTSEQPTMFMHVAPRIFVSDPGGWGRLGGNGVMLASANEAIVESAIAVAWRNTAPKSRNELTTPDHCVEG